jgi:hypothetical protein
MQEWWSDLIYQQFEPIPYDEARLMVKWIKRSLAITMPMAFFWGAITLIRGGP